MFSVRISLAAICLRVLSTAVEFLCAGLATVAVSFVGGVALGGLPAILAAGLIILLCVSAIC